MLKSMIAALVLMGATTGVIGQAQADIQWAFSHKGGLPYAMSHDHAKQAHTLLMGKRCTPADYASMVKTGRCPAMA